MAAGNPVCDSERGQRERPRTGEGGVGESILLLGFQAPKRKMRVKLMGFQTSVELAV